MFDLDRMKKALQENSYDDMIKMAEEEKDEEFKELFIDFRDSGIPIDQFFYELSKAYVDIIGPLDLN